MEETRALGQAGKKVRPIFTKPAVERAFSDALDRKQQRESDEFARREFLLRVSLDVLHPVIHPYKQRDDQVFHLHDGSHANNGKLFPAGLTLQNPRAN